MKLQRGSIVKYESGLELQYSELGFAGFTDVSETLMTKHTKDVVILDDVQEGDIVEFCKTNNRILIVNKVIK